MQFINANRTLIAGVFGAGLLVWGYFMFFAGDSSGPLLSSSSGSTVSPVTQELLVTLSNLRTIRLDETIFTNSVFESLSDFGVVIPPEAIGRRNPFAPLGTGGPVSTTTTQQAPAENE